MRRVVPGRDVLAHWVEDGLTHEQMAERIFEQTGEHVTRSAVSMALRRHNLATAELPRYRETIPWRVKVHHLRAYPVRMLRLLGRRRDGGTMSAYESERLDSWLQRLESEDVVVAYDPDSIEGFLYVRREPGDPADIPVRVRRVWLNPPVPATRHM